MLAKLCVRVAATVLFVIAVSLPALAQSDLDTVTFSGKVTDSQGLAVVGATVTATLVDTGETHTATTNDEGIYKIINLKPGTYKIKATNTGFEIKETPTLPTIAAQNVTRDFKLSPAGVKAQANVTVTDDDTP